MPTIKQIIDGRDTTFGRAFDSVVQVLIVVSLISSSIETLPELSPWMRFVLSVIEIGTVVAFTVEYLLRIYIATSRLKFIFSFFGLIDLAAILPFYLSPSLDLRSLRAFRLMRLFRILKLARYNAAVRRFHRALIIAKEEIILFVCITVAILWLSAVGIYQFEHEAQPEAFKSVFHSLWWAVTTLTTVGYGDVYPMTVGGRIFTFFVLLVGLGIVAVPAGLFSSALTKARQIEREEADANAADMET